MNAPRPITVRQLPAEEWERLRAIYASQADQLPPGERNAAVVAEMDGKIIGMWGVNLIVHAGPLWVDPEWRGKGVPDQMHAAVEQLIARLGATGYLMFPSNPGSEKAAQRLGLQSPKWKVYKKEF